MIIREVGWHDPAGERLRAAQRLEIAARYGTPDSEPGPPPTAASVTAFFVAFGGDGTGLGCGGLRRIDETHGEIKRMYVDPAHRGTGVSVALLRKLEEHGRGLGWNRLVLETGSEQPDAVRFYEREGYTRIPNFGPYVDVAASYCLQKLI